MVGVEPVGVVVARHVAVELSWRPVGHSGAEGGLRRGHPVAPRDGAVTARQHRLGLEIQGAQQLALPAVPDPRPDGADVGNGQDEQQLETLRALHDGGKVEDGLEVVEIAHLRGLAHQQVMAHQPGDQLGLVRRQPEPRAQRLGHLFPGNRMPLPPPLGDVMEQHRHIERPAARQGLNEVGGERVVVGQVAMLDVGQDAHGAQQMLVHRVVVIHVELHQRDDPAEVGDEPAEHAGLVHAPQHRFGSRLSHRIDRKMRLASGSLRRSGPMSLQRAAHLAQCIGVDGGVMVGSHAEQPDEVDRASRGRCRRQRC
jgi:hypothetical protein